MSRLAPCPSHKKGYPDDYRAIAAAIRCSRYLGPLRCYLCPDCGLWHLTRRRVWLSGSHNVGA